MRFTVDPTSSIPIYAQLIDQVKHAVASGRLQPGDPLPSLREVAERLRISPLTVKKAYGELEALGIAATEHGRGTFVRAGSDAFSAQYRRERLADAVERLLVEAYHFNATVEDVVTLVREIGARLATEQEAEDDQRIRD